VIHREKSISKEIYDNAKNGMVNREDRSKIFTEAELCGYGVYLPRVFERNGEYFCSYEIGESCD
jgi:hypothetical protein